MDVGWARRRNYGTNFWQTYDAPPPPRQPVTKKNISCLAFLQNIFYLLSLSILCHNDNIDCCQWLICCCQGLGRVGEAEEQTSDLVNKFTFDVVSFYLSFHYIINTIILFNIIVNIIKNNNHNNNNKFMGFCSQLNFFLYRLSYQP